MNNNLGYVAIDLSDTTKQMLFDFVSQQISKKDYFQSFDPGYTYINGNVCLKAHLTICYGVENSDLEKRFKNAKIKLNWQRTTKIKDVQINLGYMGKYYIVVVTPEIKKDIFWFNSWIRQNNEIIPEALPFDPHIALCYVKNQNNEYPTELLKYFQEKLIGKTLEFESVNFYCEETCTTLINLNKPHSLT